jgi:hypothetical protein
MDTGLGRPLVDTIHGSLIAPSRSYDRHRAEPVRVRPWRDSIQLVAGDEAGR